MYSQRTRNIIVGSILGVIIVIALIVLSITLYFTTDLFKANDTLFYKYIGQTLDSIKYVPNPQLAEIESLKKEKAFRLDGKLIYGESDLNANSVNAHVEIQLAKNNPKQEAYANFELIRNAETIFNVEYAKNNNIIALKSPEIVNAFLGIKNENLQELAERLGVINATLLPNCIKEININEFLNITDEQKLHLKETYLSVLQQNIDRSKFTKEKSLAVSRDGENFNTTAYRLFLTNDELRKVETAILQTLKEDNTTLNIIEEKLQMLGMDGLKSNELKSLVQTQINKINSNNSNPNEPGINIMLYVTGGRIITTEIIYNNSIKYTVYGTSEENESKRYLLIENLNIDANLEKLEIIENEIRNESESTYNAIININNKMQIKVNGINKGSTAENKLITTCKAEIDEKSKTRTINYESETKFGNNNNPNIVKLSKSNCGILNDYSESQLKALMDAVVKRTIEVVNQKLRVVGIEVNQNNE